MEESDTPNTTPFVIHSELAEGGFGVSGDEDIKDNYYNSNASDIHNDNSTTNGVGLGCDFLQTDPSNKVIIKSNSNVDRQNNVKERMASFNSRNSNMSYVPAHRVTKSNETLGRTDSFSEASLGKRKVNSNKLKEMVHMWESGSLNCTPSPSLSSSMSVHTDPVEKLPPPPAEKLPEKKLNAEEEMEQLFANIAIYNEKYINPETAVCVNKGKLPKITKEFILKTETIGKILTMEAIQEKAFLKCLKKADNYLTKFSTINFGYCEILAKLDDVDLDLKKYDPSNNDDEDEDDNDDDNTSSNNNNSNNNTKHRKSRINSNSLGFKLSKFNREGNYLTKPEIEACKHNADLLRKLIKENRTIVTKKESVWGFGLLHYAVLANNQTSLRLLLNTNLGNEHNEDGSAQTSSSTNNKTMPKKNNTNVKTTTTDAASTVVRAKRTTKCNPNVQTYQGITPLHTAAILDRRMCIRLLLEAGAIPDISNIHGIKPRDIAIGDTKLLFQYRRLQCYDYDVIKSIINTQKLY